jgi:SAM-dependent methyltransferase
MTEQYTYRDIHACPMCGHPTTDQQYLGKRLNQSGGRNPEKIKGITIPIYRCRICSLIYPNPLPILLEGDRLATTELREFWGDRILSYPHFDQELVVLSDLLRKPLKELVVLDVGFGLGNSLATMHQTCKEAHGLEPFEIFFRKALEVNGTRLDESLLQCIRFEDATYPEGKFDFIFFEALQHLPDPGPGIEKLLRWLKPGGLFYVEVPSSAYLFNRLINLYYRLRGTDFVVDTSPMHGNYSYYAFSENSFVENGKRLGYEVVRHAVLPCNPPVGGLPGRMLTTIMKSTDTSMQRGIWLRKL